MNGSTSGVTGQPAPAPPAQITEQLKAERIQALLEENPGWMLARGGTAIQRRYSVPTTSTAFVELVVLHAHQRRIPIVLYLRPNCLTVTLPTRPAQGLTTAEFDFAKHIDEIRKQKE